MLRRLYRLLQEAAQEGKTLTVADLAAQTGVREAEVRDMLAVLTWEGKVSRVGDAGCSLAGEGCAACPLKSVCVRGVSHRSEGFVLE